MAAEKKIRAMAKRNKNSYLLSIFACCREIYRVLKHCDCIFAESMAQAEKMFAPQIEAEKRKFEQQNSYSTQAFAGSTSMDARE